MTSFSSYDIAQGAWTDPGGGVYRGGGDGGGGVTDGGTGELLPRGSQHHRAHPQPERTHTHIYTQVMCHVITLQTEYLIRLTAESCGAGAGPHQMNQIR